MTTSEDRTTRRVVCLGEALVDLVCEQPVEELGEAPAFVPRQGGSLANIAVCAARFGARVEMLGGAGDDEWGRWLRERIAAEGVDVGRFVLMPDGGTSHAFVAVGADGEPRFAFYGDPKRPAAYARGDLDAALSGEPGVLVVGSDTLIGAEERETTLRAAELGRERGWQVLCDPNLRPNRWPDEGTMLRCVRELVERSSVVKCNEAEGAPLTGRRDGKQVASGLLAMGPAVAVVTRSERGALLASDGRFEEIPGHPVARVVDTTGAGDCVAGVLAAALARGFEPHALGPAVAVAMRAAAGIVERWGATSGLPPADEARAALAAAHPTEADR